MPGIRPVTIGREVSRSWERLDREPPLSKHFVLILVMRETQLPYGANRYDFDTYGFDRTRLQERFAPYLARFGVPQPSRERTIEFSRNAGVG